jgi:beta-N-acetylhexosaminidase
MRDLVRRVGQRFMLGFQGLEASTEIRKLVREFGVGHLILFSRNVDGPEQVAEMISVLQDEAHRAGHALPLLVAVDQEGGRVARMREPWTVWPPLRALGRTASEDLAEAMGRGLAAELRSCGVRWDLAPVFDVDTNPKNPVIADRSFGDDPEMVGRLGAAMVRGLQAEGVAACAKHFPGHGDTDLDSHVDLPSVGHSRGRLEDVELRPFRATIAEGVASIMTAHIVVAELDESVPATLSPRVVDGLLRKEMGFAGVIVSDDLEMKAVSKTWRPGGAAVRAALAGCDVLPVCASVDAQVEAIEAVIRAAESEQLDRKSMDDADGRIRRLKERFCLPYEAPRPKAARAAAGAAASVALAQQIADRGGWSA